MIALSRILMASAILSCVAAVVYWRYGAAVDARRIAELEAITLEMEARLKAREAMIERLSRTRRLARVEITEQRQDEAGEAAETDLLFIELDDGGAELDRQTFTIPGDVLFVDAWTVRFDYEQVAQGNPMLGRTLVLLRRVYSDRLAPQDGFPIDTPGAVPPGYAFGEVGQFEKHLWEHFWQIAQNADTAAGLGVRVAQGEAVYKPVAPGQAYELVVEASGGMTLTPVSDTQLSQVEH